MVRRLVAVLAGGLLAVGGLLIALIPSDRLLSREG
ncbi:MAG: hypothetical protein KatS3mg100_441 [Candidatus Parcubacteria bacterium]|nr:MAG: hypothetical protein KatS3mg100_441 [Candidatus Parcubacteria bacterium]